MKIDKNTMLGLGLLVGAVLIYRRNNKKGVSTIGATTSNFSGCSMCNNADGEGSETQNETYGLEGEEVALLSM